MLRDHYGLDDEAMQRLQKAGVTDKDLFKFLPLFQATDTEVTKIHLMYYADTHGDFLEGKSKSDLVAQEVFERLVMKEKLEVGGYLDWLENGE